MPGQGKIGVRAYQKANEPQPVARQTWHSLSPCITCEETVFLPWPEVSCVQFFACELLLDYLLIAAIAYRPLYENWSAKVCTIGEENSQCFVQLGDGNSAV